MDAECQPAPSAEDPRPALLCGIQTEKSCSGYPQIMQYLKGIYPPLIHKPKPL